MNFKKCLIVYVFFILLSGCSNSSNDDGDIITYESDLLTITERASRHGFPKLANNTQFSWQGDAGNGYLGENLAKRLHWYDYIVVDSDMVTNDTLGSYLGRRNSLRNKNPNAIVTAYFSPADYVDDENSIRWRELLRTYAYGSSYDPVTQVDSDLSDNFNSAEWIFQTDSSEEVWLFDFGTYWSKLQNPGESGMRDRFVNTFNDVVVATEKVDGIYHDWATSTIPSLNGVPDGHRSYQIDLDDNGFPDTATDIDNTWKLGLDELYSLGRSIYPDNFLLTGNCGWFSEPVFTNMLQGIMMEDFNSASKAVNMGWNETMYTYANYMKNGQSPYLTIVQAVIDIPDNTPTNERMLHDMLSPAPWFSASDLKEMRFTLASALMFNGYFASSNSASAGGYQAAWWFDELTIDLITGCSVFPADEDGSPAIDFKGWMGNPLGEAVNANDSGTTLWSVVEASKNNNSDNSAWKREFDNALVIVNPTDVSVDVTLTGNWKRITGQLDTIVNDGSVVISPINIPANDGIILIRN